MEIGVVTFLTDYGIEPLELARAVEERGFDALFLTEHTHIPASRRSPWPGGGDLPQRYAHTYDPFVALAAMAAVTGRVVLGTGVCLVNQHHPLNLAKEVASLDRIAGGRFELGVGPGWNVEEMEHHGVRPGRRTAEMLERIEALDRGRAGLRRRVRRVRPGLVAPQADPRPAGADRRRRSDRAGPGALPR